MTEGQVPAKCSGSATYHEGPAPSGHYLFEEPRRQWRSHAGVQDSQPLAVVLQLEERMRPVLPPVLDDDLSATPLNETIDDVGEERDDASVGYVPAPYLLGWLDECAWRRIVLEERAHGKV